MRAGAFTYNANISLGKGFRKPWEKVSSFLNTVAHNSTPSRVAIEIFEDTALPDEFLHSQRKYLDNKYELYGWNTIGNLIFHQWINPNYDFNEQISSLENLRPLPKCEVGPLDLNIRVDFQLIDSEGRLLPYQSPADYGNFISKDKKSECLGYSRLNAYLSENSTLHMFLSLPFEDEGQSLDEYISFPNSAARFKLNSRMWKK